LDRGKRGNPSSRVLAGSAAILCRANMRSSALLVCLVITAVLVLRSDKQMALWEIQGFEDSELYQLSKRPLSMDRRIPPRYNGDWRADAPGIQHHVFLSELPAPFVTRSTTKIPKIIPAHGYRPQVPPGFKVELFAVLRAPRMMRLAPNGDIFVVESALGKVKVVRPSGDSTTAAAVIEFAANMHMPFGMAFYPPGSDPQYLYVAETDSVVRFPYRNGDFYPRGPGERIIVGLPTEGHWTRDITFSRDGRQMFISIGSRSNDAERMPLLRPTGIETIERDYGVGAAWAYEEGRAQILVSDPNGSSVRTFATGLRNCISMAIQPSSGTLWCANDERDHFGDDLVPDFITTVHAGDFFGWPWFYVGGFEDPVHGGERPDLRDRVRQPDLLLPPHSAPMSVTFGTSTRFPTSYQASLFVALHGSYNRSQFTGYKVVRFLQYHDQWTGSYEDFATGFVHSESSVWGRPAGLSITADGALLVADDANGNIWKISYEGEEIEQNAIPVYRGDKTK
jgi:glucose/arabinose dehydrogenase